ncbi:MAG: hypothetical protein IPP33_08065 [Flavobacteriales bacterium]|nr:hypothetical protein [Flavobacteriales bacterium]
MKPCYTCIPLVFMLISCGSQGDTETGSVDTPLDADLMGDVRVTTADTIIRLCGTGKRYRLSGPAMDTIADRYRYAVSRKGNWAKLWFKGHLGTITSANHTDSVFFAVNYQHLDASLNCEPVPDPRISGRYKLEQNDPTHPRSILLDLFDDGVVIMYSDLYDGAGPIEENGHWGTTADDLVNIKWPKRDQTMSYHWDGSSHLNGNKLPNGMALSLLRTGSADRNPSALGRATRWLAAAATANGHPCKPTDISPSTELSELFTTEAARTSLALAARDTFNWNEEEFKLTWTNISNVQEVVDLMRARIHN